MTKITRDEFIKLAQISALQIPEDKIDAYSTQLGHRLTYVTQLQDILSQQLDIPVQKPVCEANLLRKDVAAETAAVPLLALAPERIDRYVVVPVIIK